MAMFFDLLFEKADDAYLVAQQLSTVGDGYPKVIGADQALLDDQTHPVIVFDRKLLERSKSINQKRVSHPVNYAFHLSVRDSRTKQADEFIFKLLSACIAQMIGCVSLISYGDSLLFRKIGDSISLYNSDCFWDEAKIQVFRRTTHCEVNVSAEKCFVE